MSGPKFRPPFVLGVPEEPVQLTQSMLGFEPPGMNEARFGTDIIFRAAPFRSFRPVGLAIFNAPPGALVRAIITAGGTHELLASSDSVPARMFAGFESFAALKKRVEEDGETLVGWGDFCTVYPGNELIILLRRVTPAEAQEIEIGAWGLSVVV